MYISLSIYIYIERERYRYIDTYVMEASYQFASTSNAGSQRPASEVLHVLLQIVSGPAPVQPRRRALTVIVIIVFIISMLCD